MEKGIIYRKSSTSEKNIDTFSDSRFWSIEGKNVQFTCFEVPANKHFPLHKHSSEQITYVIEGELFFRSTNRVYKLTTGDCIFIPGDTEHEVWTEQETATAVDAWSPVNKTFSTNNP